MVVTIINQDDVTFTFQDGDITNITSQVTSSIEQYGITGLTFDYSQLGDYEGVLKAITITGVLTEANTTRTDTGTTKTIAEQKTWLEGLQTGFQQPKGFVSTYENYNVMVANFKTTDNAGIPGQLPFTLTLMVGSY